jgi:predicted transcriptional regulator
MYVTRAKDEEIDMGTLLFHCIINEYNEDDTFYMVRFLVDMGASIYEKRNITDSFYDINNYLVPENDEGDIRITPLAATFCNINSNPNKKVIQYLLDSGADANEDCVYEIVKTNVNREAVQLLMNHGFEATKGFELSFYDIYDIPIFMWNTKTWMELGVDINVQDRHGRTVFLAIWDEYINFMGPLLLNILSIYLILREMGWNPQIHDEYGRTALSVMEEALPHFQNSPDFVQVLNDLRKRNTNIKQLKNFQSKQKDSQTFKFKVIPDAIIKYFRQIREERATTGKEKVLTNPDLQKKIMQYLRPDPKSSFGGGTHRHRLRLRRHRPNTVRRRRR